MGRFLILILLVALAVWLVRRALSKPSARATPPPSVEGELVTCAHCGVHLPRSEALPAGEALYCSEEHARLGPGAPR